MSDRLAVILVVALSDRLIGEHTRVLRAFRDERGHARFTPPLPAVTCTSQSTLLTGLTAREHGIVGNGWYDRESAEIRFWKQSNRLVNGEKLWERARRERSGFSVAKLFWWYNMYAPVDVAVTPRPLYKADGRKIPDCYAEPPELRDRLTERLGRFPLFQFWGPGASIVSTRWIADAARLVDEWHAPSLSLVYLPHLDYALQKHGPDGAPARDAVAEVDAVLGELVAHYDARGVRTVILSEYGIEPVDTPIHVNRLLRREGLVRVRVEDGLEMLDPGASRAFAVADHQVAHVYVRDPHDVEPVARLLAGEPDIERVLGADGKRDAGLDHERAGDLVAVARSGAWFTYYYWLDDRVAPDFARTVDIHRKPGYDPVELFLDPRLKAPKLAVGSRIVKKKLGFRTLLDVIPLDASLVRGSHGRAEMPGDLQPIVMGLGDRGAGITSAIDVARALRAIVGDDA